MSATLLKNDCGFKFIFFHYCHSKIVKIQQPLRILGLVVVLARYGWFPLSLDKVWIGSGWVYPLAVPTQSKQ